MRVITAILAGLCSACTGPAPIPAPGKVVEPAPHAVAVVTETGPRTVVDRNLARSERCHVVRALDGRAVCAAADPAPQSDEASTSARAPLVVEAPQSDALYLVIGSFAELENAQRWATFNDVFGTDIRAARFERDGRTMHRVVVGPIARDNASLMHEILSSAGAGRSWQLSACAASPAAGSNDADCTVLDAQALAANTAE